ncbi:pyridoxamine 5'-phosphate oxidase [Mycolicibacillus koreensis]|nr:pyridoxamine 5'-phosphate oxidase [Mycolicibacillus koreensis]
MSFTEDEIAYLRSQPLARIATVGDDDQPDVVPVGFDYDGTHINIGGYRPAATRRHRNVLAGHTKVAVVIDDLVSTEPWIPRYLRVYGTATVVEGAVQPFLRITPEVSWSWNVNAGSGPMSMDTPPHRTVHR